MKKIVLIGAAAIVAGGIATTPAIAGLAGNSSFSRQIPVQVPSQASPPQLVDDHSPARLATPTATRHVEPGDDRGAASRTAEPGDDRGAASRTAEPGDDSGGHGGGGNSSGGHGSDG